MAELKHGDLRKFVFAVSEYKEKVYLNLRLWQRYDVRDEDDWKPTRKGISIPMGMAGDFKKAINQFLIEIENYRKESAKNEREKKRPAAQRN